MQRDSLSEISLAEISRALVALVACVCVVNGCTEYKPASDTLTESLAEQDQWYCLDTPAPPPRTPGSPGDTIIYSLQLVDLASDAPYPDVSITACGLTDVECDRPIAQTVTDADGFFSIRLTENFVGYLELEPAAGTAVPYLFHLPEIPLRTMNDFPLAMIGLDSFFALLAAFELPVDPTQGGIAVRAFDCEGSPASGVVLKNEKGGVPWYFEENLPNTERQETDEGGLGGFIDSDLGVSILEAELTDGSTVIRKSVIVRPGWLTAGYMKPLAVEP
jgi:hypothetical protein